MSTSRNKDGHMSCTILSLSRKAVQDNHPLFSSMNPEPVAIDHLCKEDASFAASFVPQPPSQVALTHPQWYIPARQGLAQGTVCQFRRLAITGSTRRTSSVFMLGRICTRRGPKKTHGAEQQKSARANEAHRLCPCCWPSSPASLASLSISCPVGDGHVAV